jgi:hypothetical protein
MADADRATSPRCGALIPSDERALAESDHWIGIEGVARFRLAPRCPPVRRSACQHPNDPPGRLAVARADNSVLLEIVGRRVRRKRYRRRRCPRLSAAANRDMPGSRRVGGSRSARTRRVSASASDRRSAGSAGRRPSDAPVRRHRRALQPGRARNRRGALRNWLMSVSDGGRW